MRLIETLPAVVPTPAEYRVWIDEARALEILRCAPEQLEELVQAGLFREDGRYDNYDIWNLGLRSGSGLTRPEREMIFFARVLKSFGADWVSSRRYVVTGSAQCPRGEDCRSSDWSAPALAEVRWDEEVMTPGRAQWRGEVVLSGRNATINDPRIQRVWDDLIAQYGFQFTSDRLARDLDLTRARKVGDCDALCRVLMQELGSLGIRTELQPGYIFGGARMRRHSWLRVLDSDGEAKVLDPSMALLADLFFTPEYKSFCCGSRLNRTVRRPRHEDALAAHPCAEGTALFYEFELQPARSDAPSRPVPTPVPVPVPVTAGRS